MPTYTINGRKFTSQEPLSDSDLEELATSVGITPPAAPPSTMQQLSHNVENLSPRHLELQQKVHSTQQINLGQSTRCHSATCGISTLARSTMSKYRHSVTS